MKRFLAALVLAGIITTGAQARSPAPDEYVYMDVACTYINVQPRGQEDRDPIYKILIHLRWNSDHARFDGMYVEHLSRGGHVYNRMQQYKNITIQDRSHNPVDFDVFWQGERPPYGTMTGHLLWADGRYSYNETLVNYNGNITMQMSSVCAVINGG